MGFDKKKKNRWEKRKKTLPPEMQEKIAALEGADRFNPLGERKAKKSNPQENEDKNDVVQNTPNDRIGIQNVQPAQNGKPVKPEEVEPADQEFEGYLFAYDKNAGKENEKDYFPEFGCKSGNNKQMDDVPAKILEYYKLAEETNTVIEILYSPKRVKALTNIDKYNANMELSINKRNDYIKKLISISQVGLNTANPQPALATESLNKMRKEIMIKEGGKIKKWYTSRLGLWVAIVAAAFFALAVWMASLSGAEPEQAENPDQSAAAAETVETEETALENGENDDETNKEDETWWARTFKDNAIYAYCYAFVGAAIATWVSFLIRRRNMEFIHLVMMEEDRMSCLARVMFTCALAFLFMLF